MPTIMPDQYRIRCKDNVIHKEILFSSYSSDLFGIISDTEKTMVTMNNKISNTYCIDQKIGKNWEAWINNE